MKTVAVLPINHLSKVKSRLSSTGIDRPRLALQLLKRVLAELGQIDEIEARWVICPDAEVRSHALEAGAEWLLQTGSGLNPALIQARQHAQEEGFERLLIVLPDLPYLKASEVSELLALDQEKMVLSLAPDRWNRGTNLWLAQPIEGSPSFFFGENSFAAHQEAALAAGWRCQILRAVGCASDLDTAEDWEEFRWSLPSNCCL